jgi:hypothetical protein
MDSLLRKSRHQHTPRPGAYNTKRNTDSRSFTPPHAHNSLENLPRRKALLAWTTLLREKRTCERKIIRLSLAHQQEERWPQVRPLPRTFRPFTLGSFCHRRGSETQSIGTPPYIRGCMDRQHSSHDNVCAATVLSALQCRAANERMLQWRAPASPQCPPSDLVASRRAGTGTSVGSEEKQETPARQRKEGSSPHVASIHEKAQHSTHVIRC